MPPPIAPKDKPCDLTPLGAELTFDGCRGIRRRTIATPGAMTTRHLSPSSIIWQVALDRKGQAAMSG